MTGPRIGRGGKRGAGRRARCNGPAGAAAAVTMALVLIGCTATNTTGMVTTSVTSGVERPRPPGSFATSTTAGAPAAIGIIRSTIDAVNAAAGGTVARQQDLLRSLVDPGQSGEQRRCAAATTTISFEPVYSRLAPSPSWQPDTGTVGGTVYSLPTLIRIYTGSRITGTDLADLHLSVDAGRARLAALCVS